MYVSFYFWWESSLPKTKKLIKPKTITYWKESNTNVTNLRYRVLNSIILLKEKYFWFLFYFYFKENFLHKYKYTKIEKKYFENLSKDFFFLHENRFLFTPL